MKFYDKKRVKKKVLNWRKKLENVVVYDKDITVKGLTK